METFVAFVIKEFKHIFRDKRSLMILFGMPIVQVLLFGFAISTEIKEAKYSVLDLSSSPMAKEYVNALSSSNCFVQLEYLSNSEQIDKAFKRGDIKFVLVIPEDFDQNLEQHNRINIQSIFDASDPNTASIISTYLESSSINYLNRIKPASFNTFDIETKMLYNPESKSIYMFVPGVMTVILMLISAMMTSITVAREKERGTMEILLVSPLRPYIIIIGKVIPYIVLSLVNALTILLLGFIVFAMPMNGSYPMLAFEILLFVSTSLSLGVLISTVAQSQQAAMMISLMGLMLPTILLSGFIFPIEGMPIPLQIISNIVPAKWFIIIIKSIMLKGVAFSQIITETSILLFMNLFFIGLSVKKFKNRLE